MNIGRMWSFKYSSFWNANYILLLASVLCFKLVTEKVYHPWTTTKANLWPLKISKILGYATLEPWPALTSLSLRYYWYHFPSPNSYKVSPLKGDRDRVKKNPLCPQHHKEVFLFLSKADRILDVRITDSSFLKQQCSHLSYNLHFLDQMNS